MTSNYVVDTMAIVLRLERRKLSKRIKNVFAAAEIGEIGLLIPAVAAFEIGYLAERNRIEIGLATLKDYIDENNSIEMADLDLSIILKSFEITDIPELHDRLIAGIAYAKDLEVITNDPDIIASEFVTTVW